MLLAVDIGNTNITLGVFDKDRLLKTFRLKTIVGKDYESELRALLQRFKVTSCAIGSVVTELTSVIKENCDKIFGLNSFVFTAQNSGVVIALDEPEQVGADRLINVCGVLDKYALPAIVVDIGTAITFDVVSKDKKFLGGAIMPGINLQFLVLNQYTSKLPLVEAGESEAAIGKDTKSAILSGVIRGIAGSVDGLVQQCEKELGEQVTLIATGGQSCLVADYLSRKFDVINPDLTLEGLRAAYLSSHVNLY